MADKKTETKPEKIEREYVIPLRKKVKRAVRYKKTPKAIKTVKEFLARHFRITNRNLKNVRLDKLLNEFLWARGIKNPPHKVKVKAVKEGDIVRAELVDYPTKLKFKKARLERIAKAQEDVKDKKKASEKAVAKKEPEKSLEDKTQTTEDKKEEKEKKTSIVEAGEDRAKSEHKTEKHQTQAKTQKSKRPVRQAMQK